MDITSVVVLIVVITLFAYLFWRINRKINDQTKTSTDKLEKVISLLQSIDFNIKNISTRTTEYRSKKRFRVYAWITNKEKLEFIDQGIIDKLREGFTVAEECNSKIEMAFKSKDLASLQMLDMEKMREPLNTARVGLVEWLKKDYESKHPEIASNNVLKR